MRYLENLNTSQRAAVTAPLGPVSVLAGPGSGKTRVLTNRIQHLFYNHNFTPSRIRAVTFTQNGTQTMRERLDGDGVRDVRISTFHSLCRSIIDAHYQRDPELVALCEAAGVVMPFCWHSFQRKENQPHLDWYKTDGRLVPDVAIWITFQYACVAFSQRTIWCFATIATMPEPFRNLYLFCPSTSLILFLGIRWIQRFTSPQNSLYYPSGKS